MTARDDFPYEMHEFPFDNSDADAVFGASAGADSVPEDLRDVAELVYVARGAGSTDELAGDDVIVAQIAAAIREHAAPPRGDANERSSVLTKVRSAKLTAVATAAVMLGATAAAAATGSLPSPGHHSTGSTPSAVVTVPAHAKTTVAPNLRKRVAKHNAAAKKHALAKKHAALAAAAKAAHAHHKAVGGIVVSVNGVTDPGTCGTATTAGTFSVTGRTKTFTVNVEPATTYREQDVSGASFANVCVGKLALAKGTIADTTVTATKVYIATVRHDPPSEPDHKSGAFGTVASVNGGADPGTCGTAGAAGSFTLTDRKGTTFTVNVDSATDFDKHGQTDASFAKVCVGAKVGVFGELTDTTIVATKAFVFGDHDPHDGHRDRHDCDRSKQDPGKRWSGRHHRHGDDSDHKSDHSDHDSVQGSRHGR